ncbi:hypothetical protein L218DRAFT_1003500 [Marasmius fiardii PR-910]|nr:hypothetical protein L218DRAFT_1003500 [Marasmius fiardii PR-910]
MIPPFQLHQLPDHEDTNMSATEDHVTALQASQQQILEALQNLSNLVSNNLPAQPQTAAPQPEAACSAPTPTLPEVTLVPQLPQPRASPPSKFDGDCSMG